MTEDVTGQVPEETGTAPRERHRVRYSMAPMVTAVAVTALALPALGIALPHALSASDKATSSISAPATPGSTQSTDPSSTTDPGGAGETTTDPEGTGSTTNPDRDSDQPGESETAEPYTIYQVQAGDTLTKISAKFGVSVDAIAELNQIRDVNVIYADSALQIPTLKIPLKKD